MLLCPSLIKQAGAVFPTCQLFSLPVNSQLAGIPVQVSEASQEALTVCQRFWVCRRWGRGVLLGYGGCNRVGNQKWSIDALIQCPFYRRKYFLHKLLTTGVSLYSSCPPYTNILPPNIRSLAKFYHIHLTWSFLPSNIRSLTLVHWRRRLPERERWDN